LSPSIVDFQIARAGVLDGQTSRLRLVRGGRLRREAAERQHAQGNHHAHAKDDGQRAEGEPSIGPAAEPAARVSAGAVLATNSGPVGTLGRKREEGIDVFRRWRPAAGAGFVPNNRLNQPARRRFRPAARAAGGSGIDASGFVDGALR